MCFWSALLDGLLTNTSSSKQDMKKVHILRGISLSGTCSGNYS